jgi:Chaperone of endosialidase
MSKIERPEADQKTPHLGPPPPPPTGTIILDAAAAPPAMTVTVSAARGAATPKMGPPPPPATNGNGSDIRLKTDIRQIGSTVFGLPLYQFKYVGAPETYEGVMAHEVLQVMPSAVSVGSDGFYRVDYGALGTSMRRVS